MEGRVEDGEIHKSLNKSSPIAGDDIKV